MSTRVVAHGGRVDRTHAKHVHRRTGARAEVRSGKGVTTRRATTRRGVEPQLVLTGYYEKRRHLVCWAGYHVWLPTSLFSAMCDLAHALIVTTTGFCRVDRRIAMRLRTELLRATARPDLVTALVRTGAKDHYRLALSIEAVFLDRSFAELNGSDFSTAEIRQALMRRCHKCDIPATEL